MSQKAKNNTTIEKNRRKGKSTDKIANSSSFTTGKKNSHDALMRNQMFVISFSFLPSTQTSVKLSKKEHVRQVSAAQVFMSPMQYIYLNLRIA